MRLGDLTAAHIGRVVTFTDGTARVVDSVRHFRLSVDGSKEKVARTSVMLGSTGAKGDSHLGEHLADSNETIVLANG
jgi:hypothetical protein